ncbi:DedA family protein [Thorsellia anophelis]|uniref:Membrane protein DedA, SNARE-associated domain n=1 Tax=Thorsellia anophelis DSM 18579 TaxID=1123402 RepID=A0A1H9YWG9_9GAMM|nr:DedA family protein [Thorsellia anophelis]SES73510.1 membrane protein DedA, SNARE-associated domain [Thorsellia anophelis DSM 18579]
MELLQNLFFALWTHDFATLQDPNVLWALYLILFLILFLENGLLPAAFLPGDSLLILVGVLISKDTMNLPFTLILLVAGASLGSWVGYLQGLWLGNTTIVKSWLGHLPQKYHQRTHDLFYKHGLMALLIGRFIAFVRTLMPTLAGISGLEPKRFQIFNWLSSIFWVLSLTLVGYVFGNTKIFEKYETQFMHILMILPIVLLVFGLISSIYMIWSKKRNNPPKK